MVGAGSAHPQLRFEPLIIIPVGAVAAALGRLALANGARRMRGRFSRERLTSLAAAEKALTASRPRALLGLGLFALSPVPSAQLFIAAGLLRVRLLPLTAAFFAGRLVSYSLYVGATTAASASLGELIGDSLTSPLGVALQLAMLAGLVVLVRVDWAHVLGPRGPAPRSPRVVPASGRKAP